MNVSPTGWRGAALTNHPSKLRRFDELMDAARYTLRLTEDHSYWIDQMGVAALRRFFLSVGARLVAKGVIDRRDDVFFLHVDELRQALHSGGDQRGSVAQRRAALEASARIVPPLHLGAPTPMNPDPLFVAIVDKALGLLPVEPSADPDVISGVARAIAQICRRTHERLPRSVGAWTGFPSRWNWRRRGSTRSPRMSSSASSTNASGYLLAVTALPCLASRPSSRRWTGATSS
jgi:hypothetical protein